MRFNTRVSVAMLVLCLSAGLAAAPAALATTIPDSFASAVSAKPLPFSAAFNTGSATTEANEPIYPPCSSASTGATVWYTWQSSTAMTLQASTAGSDFDTDLVIFRGTAINALTAVACDDDIANGDLASNTQSRVTWKAAANTKYYIQVGGWAGTSGNLSFSLRSVTRPANDDLANAQSITSLPADVSPDITNATLESGEAAWSPDSCASGGPSVWYKFHATTASVMRVETLGASIDTFVAVYRGTPSSQTQIACSDDLVTGGVEHYASSAAWRTVAGVNYYIQVMGSRGQTQSGMPVQFRKVTAVGNDSFGHATKITSLPFSAPFDVRNATHQKREHADDCGHDGWHSIWFKYTPAANGTVSADAPSAVWTRRTITVYTGSKIGNLSQLQCTVGGSLSNIPVTGGVTYYFRLDGSYGTAGQATFSLTTP